jgi:hypothetical protein
MAHARKQVSDAVYALLNAAPVAWSLVWQNRVHPTRGVTPYVQVWIDSEDINAEDVHSDHLQMRNMSLITRGRLRTIEHEENEDRADDLVAEIETTLTTAALNTQLSNKLRKLHLESVDVGFAEEDDEREFIEATLVWTVEVFTIHGSPETLV